MWGQTVCVNQAESTVDFLSKFCFSSVEVHPIYSMLSLMHSLDRDSHAIFEDVLDLYFCSQLRSTAMCSTEQKRMPKRYQNYPSGLFMGLLQTDLLLLVALHVQATY